MIITVGIDHEAIPTSRGEGGIHTHPGEYLPTLRVGVCRPSLQILTLFQTRKATFYTLFKVNSPGEYLPIIWLGGVLPKPSNPDSISDPKKATFYTLFKVNSPGEYLPIIWLGVCYPSLQILTPISDPKSNFLYPI